MAAPTRAEFERLKAHNAELMREIEALKESARETRQALKIQFQRIAEMQAILDEERRAQRPTTPNPPIRQLPDGPT